MRFVTVFDPRIFEDDTCGRPEYRVLHYIGSIIDRHGSRSGWCTVCLDTMTEKTGLSRPTLMKAINLLVDGRYLFVRRGLAGPEGYRRANEYFVNSNGPHATAPEEPAEQPDLDLGIQSKAGFTQDTHLSKEKAQSRVKGPAGSAFTTSSSISSSTANHSGTDTKTTWMTPYWDAWKDRFGGNPPSGPMAKHLKPLDDEYGPARLTPAWVSFLEEVDVQYMGTGHGLPAKFATAVGVWLGDKPRNNKREPGIYDEPGEENLIV